VNDRNPAIVVGLDGGGTKTHAMVADARGRILGFATSGPTNWEGVGLEGTRTQVHAVVADALDAAGVEAGGVDGAAFAMAGFDWPSDHARLDPILADLGLGGPRSLMNDAFAALRAGSADRHGCVSVAGTGGSVAGRYRAGTIFRTFACGYGEPNGAETLVADALNAIARAYFGQSDPTDLAPRFLAALGLLSVPALFEGLARDDLDGLTDLNELAPLVLEVARAGDDAARAIAHQVGGDHGRAVAGVVRKLDMTDDELDVVRAGGVHAAGDPRFDRAFADAVLAGVPGARIVSLTTPPVVGAALLALELIGLDADSVHDAMAEEAMTHAAAAARDDTGTGETGRWAPSRSTE
jgi:N-acetylglucosamine kinase-like BadF-type ATPase